VLDPEYYAVLYQMEVEMLYYFIEPVLSELIKNYHMHFNGNFDGFYKYVKESLNV